ncbi:MAG: glycosyltransferase family 4 protein [Bacillota bacterium]|nr:glycosyltransferase family 4 protein [Bacillota bacterium]
MKILVITPLYHIEGREDLVHDTSAVHYLLKYNADINDIVVVNTYMNRKKNVFKYMNPVRLFRFLNGYRYEIDGIQVHLIESFMLSDFRFSRIDRLRIKRTIRNATASWNTEPDLVIVHFPNMAVSYISEIRGKRKVAVLHASDVNASKRDRDLTNNLTSCYDACYARSMNIQRHFKAAGVSNLSDVIILSGAPRVEAATGKAKDRFSQGRIRVLYAGKLIRRKRVDYIIKALSRIERGKIQLDIVGEGPESDKLKDMVLKEKLEDFVIFHGQQSRETVIEMMKSADVFCMPSVEETFGLVYIEAMACGCVTIGTKGEGIDGLIQDGVNGYLVDGLCSLVDILKRIAYCSDRMVLMRISHAAVNTASEFTEEKMSRRYLDVLSGKIN